MVPRRLDHRNRKRAGMPDLEYELSIGLRAGRLVDSDRDAAVERPGARVLVAAALVAGRHDERGARLVGGEQLVERNLEVAGAVVWSGVAAETEVDDDWLSQERCFFDGEAAAGDDIAVGERRVSVS